MEKIEIGQSRRFGRKIDFKKLKQRGLIPDLIPEEERMTGGISPSNRGEESIPGSVPSWLVKYVDGLRERTGTVEEMRSVLSKLKSSLSDTIIEERYGNGER